MCVSMWWLLPCWYAGPQTEPTMFVQHQQAASTAGMAGSWHRYKRHLQLQQRQPLVPSPAEAEAAAEAGGSLLSFGPPQTQPKLKSSCWTASTPLSSSSSSSSSQQLAMPLLPPLPPQQQVMQPAQQQAPLLVFSPNIGGGDGRYTASPQLSSWWGAPPLGLKTCGWLA